VLEIATSRRTPLGSITTSLGARGIVFILDFEALQSKAAPKRELAGTAHGRESRGRSK